MPEAVGDSVVVPEYVQVLGAFKVTALLELSWNETLPVPLTLFTRVKAAARRRTKLELLMILPVPSCPPPPLLPICKVPALMVAAPV